MEEKYKFELGDKVEIECSGETGIVVGRSDFVNLNDRFLIRYKAGDGRANEVWWDEDALKAVAV